MQRAKAVIYQLLTDALNGLSDRMKFCARASLALVFVAALTGCAGAVPRAVAEADRDTTGRFDGEWLVRVDATRNKQEIQRWVMSCQTDAYILPMLVRSGKASINIGDAQSHETYQAWVDDKGRFRMSIPTDASAHESGTSDDKIIAGEITIILRGILGGNKQVGYVTNGIRQFGNNGCTYRVRFEPRGTSI
jgi:hypothetical protein